MFGWLTRDRVEKGLRVSRLLEELDALQQDQQRIGRELNEISERLTSLERKFETLRSMMDLREERLRAELQRDAMAETQAAVNAVQGQFYQRLTDLAVEIDRLKRTGDSNSVNKALSHSPSKKEN